METTDTTSLPLLRRTYPMKLRRGEAVRLAAVFGLSEYSFRTLVTAGKITPQHFTGKAAHYDREQILAVLA